MTAARVCWACTSRARADTRSPRCWMTTTLLSTPGIQIASQAGWRRPPRLRASDVRDLVATVYRVHVIHIDRLNWVSAVAQALTAEVHALGLHRSVDVHVGPPPTANEPAVTVYFGSPAAAADASCATAIDEALSNLRVVFPVVDDLANYSSLVPPSLRPINGWEWLGGDAPERLARLLLEELGVEERQRSVFISHKREDGLLAAEQLYEHLSKHGFDPFIDRFDIRTAVDVQATIADALEARAFLLLLETPLAHTSEYVFDEVDYALSHTMGLHIVTWPGGPTEVPGSSRLPREQLTAADLVPLKGYEVLTDVALDHVLGEVEAAHAIALVRRRRGLLRNVEDSTESKGFSCTPLPGWRLLVQGAGHRDVVGVTGRLPE